jgi:CyaY protein
MNESEYNDLVDQKFDAIEDSLEELDLDFDQLEGVLNIECPDGSMIILSRQSATNEIWVAARSGGYHLAMVDDGWVCNRTNESFKSLLERVLQEQTDCTVSLNI